MKKLIILITLFLSWFSLSFANEIDKQFNFFTDKIKQKVENDSSSSLNLKFLDKVKTFYNNISNNSKEVENIDKSVYLMLVSNAYYRQENTYFNVFVTAFDKKLDKKLTLLEKIKYTKNVKNRLNDAITQIEKLWNKYEKINNFLKLVWYYLNWKEKILELANIWYISYDNFHFYELEFEPKKVTFN